MAGDKVKFSTGTVVDADGYLYQAGSKITATASELNNIADITSDAMSASTIMAALIETYNVYTIRSGSIIKTVMYLDITGALSVATDLDIIGNTGACHIGQVTTAVNGLVFSGKVSCAEVPAGGTLDIDLYSATVGTGAYDAGIVALTETALMTAGGALAVGADHPFTLAPPANDYLYLCSGEAANAGTYTAGKLVIEMWGLVV
jgi:hypothetical protein